MEKEETTETKQETNNLQEELGKYYHQYLNWLAFNDNESLAINLLRLLYKIPLSIILVTLSPIMIVFLIVIFFASF